MNTRKPRQCFYIPPDQHDENGYDAEYDTIEHGNPGPCPVHPGL